jgi:uncharacterized repeat protein (TIGR01451 family)
MKRFLVALALVLGILPLTIILVAAQNAWTNGQDALYVIGQPDFTSASSGTSETRLNYPKDVAIDLAHGKLYVIDAFNNRVLRFSYPITGSQPAAELVFGQANFNSSSFGTTVNQFNDPRGITVDASGRLWVADRANNRVVWFNDAFADADNQPDADGVLGQPDFVTQIPTTTQSGMNNPYGLAVSTEGTLVFADAVNNRVLVFEDAASKSNGALADKVLGQPDFVSNSPAATQSGMSTPRGIALFGDTLFVAERNNARVLRFDNVLAKADGAGADGVLGQPDFSSNTKAITQDGLEYPGRLAVDMGGRLYVSDGFNADRIMIYADAANKANGAEADFVLGQPDFTSSGSAVAQNRLSMDSSGGGMAVDSLNNLLLVSDDNNSRIMIFQASEGLGIPVLSIEKSGPALVLPGDPITFSLSVTNTGTLTATNLVITDTLPAGANYLNGGTLMPGGVVSWTLPSLGIGADAQVQFAVNASRTITNANYAVTSAEGASAVGQKAVVTSGYPMLAIGKSGPALAFPGDPITYSLSVTNTGTLTATNLVITDTLPAGANYLNGGTLMPGGVVSWTLPSLGIDADAQVQFAVTASHTITNAVYAVTSAQGASAVGQKAVVTSDGRDVYYPILAIEKSGPALVLPGEPITYSLFITNTGTLTATNLIITDTLPAGANYLNGGTLMPGGVVSWTLPSLGVGADARVQFAVTATHGTITNAIYGVICAQGASAAGREAVVTVALDGRRFFYPLIAK